MYCVYSIGNTGTGTTPFIGAPRKLFLRPRFDFNGNQNTIGLVGTGNKFAGTVAQAAYTVTGTGTAFLNAFNPGDTYAPVGGIAGIVTFVTSNTSMTVSINQTITAGAAYNIFNLSYITALTLQPDPSKRLYPLPTGKDGSDNREKDIMETFEDDTQQKVQKGVRKVMYKLTRENQGAIAYLAGQLDPIWSQGIPTDMYYLDIYGNWVGAYNVPGQLDGRQLDSGSLSSIFNPGENKKANVIDISFNIHVDEVDANMAVIRNCEMDSTIQTKIGGISGLLDASPVYSGLSATGFTIALQTAYGTPETPVNATGLSVNNFTSSAPVPVKTITVTSIALLLGDIVVGEVSNAVGQVVKINSATSYDVAIASGTFTNSDVACTVYRNTNGAVQLVVGLSPDINAVAAATYTITLTGFINDTTFGGYVPLASAVEQKSSGRPIGIYAVTFITLNSQPAVLDIITPYIVNIQGNSSRYYDFTNVNANTTPVVL